MINLSGRIAIVTGASRGIGRATARMLAATGAEVVAAARGDNARATVEEITGAGGKAHPASLDVTDRGSIDRVVAETLERSGRIDILVSNAGVARDQGEEVSHARGRRWAARRRPVPNCLPRRPPRSGYRGSCWQAPRESVPRILGRSACKVVKFIVILRLLDS